LHPGLVRHHRGTGDNLVRRQIAVDPRARRDHTWVADRDVSPKPGLPADHDMVADDGTSCDPHLSHHDAVLSDRDIVGDLNEIVHLGPAPDDRAAERGAIHGHVRAEFDVVLNRDGSDLGDLVMAALILDIAEAVTADHGAAVDDDPTPDDASFSHGDVGIEDRVVSHH